MAEIGAQKRPILSGDLVFRSADPSDLGNMDALGRLGPWSGDASGASPWAEPAEAG